MSLALTCAATREPEAARVGRWPNKHKVGTSRRRFARSASMAPPTMSQERNWSRRPVQLAKQGRGGAPSSRMPTVRAV